MIDVVTVFAPREEYAHWREFLPMLDLQRRSVEKIGHRHVVVSDVDGLRMMELHKYQLFTAELSQSLMHLQLEGQLAYLNHWSGEYPLVFVDADCLVLRDLGRVFAPGNFEIGLTRRDNPVAPINNGAMYIAAGAKAAALKFFGRALELCQAHWGGDQEAIAQAAAPVPEKYCIKRRGAARIAFMPMSLYNWTPKVEGVHSGKNPYVAHFKGERKAWMKTYAEAFLGLG